MNDKNKDIDDLIGKLFFSHIKSNEWKNNPVVKDTKKKKEKSIHTTGRTDDDMKERKGRMINKEISDSEKFASLSPEAAVLFCMLIPHYNSYGKMNGGSGYVKDEVCPKVPYLKIENIPTLLQEISQKTNVKYFSYNGRFWIHSLNFLSKHQDLREDKMGSDKLPNYTENSDLVQDKSGTSQGETKNSDITNNNIEIQEDIENFNLVQDKSGTSTGEVSLEDKIKIKIKTKDKIKIKTKAEGGAKNSAFILPDWIQKDAWDGYEEMRKKKRAPMTDRARILTIQKLQIAKDAGCDPNAMIDQSTEKGWTGIFEVRENKNEKSGNGKNEYRRNGDSSSAEGVTQKTRGDQTIPDKYSGIGEKLTS